MMKEKIYQQLNESLHQHKEFFLLTITGFPVSELIGSKILLWPDGSSFTEETLPPKLAKQIVKDCEVILKKKRSRTVQFLYQGSPVECFAEYFPAPVHLIIAGAGHICEPVAKMGKLLGFYVTVLDDRPEFANDIRYPHVDEVACQPYLQYFKNARLTNETYILLLTRGHKFDVQILRELLLRTEKAAYVGMVGSRRRISGVFQELKEDFPDENFDYIFTPVGLDIGAETPAEIAVSIMAEILKIKNKATGHSLSDKVRKFARMGFHEGAAAKWNRYT